MAKRIPHIQQNRPNDFQTPETGLDSLIPFLQPFKRIWEPACGKGNLTRRLYREGFEVVNSDILTGDDFLLCDIPDVDCIVTNPPFSIKNEWIARCYSIGLPFALLMPLTALETAARQRYWREGVEIIFPPSRIHFETPSGTGSGSWFYTVWYTRGLNVGRALTFCSGSVSSTNQTLPGLQEKEQ